MLFKIEPGGMAWCENCIMHMQQRIAWQSGMAEPDLLCKLQYVELSE